MLVTSANWHLICLVISIIDRDDYQFCLAKCENKYQYTKFRNSMYKYCHTNKDLMSNWYWKTNIYIYIYIYICVCVYIYVYIYIYIYLHCSWFWSRNNECQHEVAIFTAWWELCLSHFNHRETDSKTQVKWYWEGKTELLGEKPVLFHSSATSTLYNLSNLQWC